MILMGDLQDPDFLWSYVNVQNMFGHMSYGQYSWLITIKNGASHPMVHRDL